MGDMGDYWKDVKAAKKAAKRDVKVITRSPMNALRWCLQLSCGHDVWVTRKGPPKVQRLFCERCATAAASDGDSRA